MFRDALAPERLSSDSQNRLASCTYTAGGNTTTSSLTYGADGLRRSMSVTSGGNTTTTDFVLEGQNVIQEKQNGSLYATYLNGPRGVEYREDNTGAKSWYLYDGHGNVLGEVDTDGNVTATSKYDVFGGVRSGTGTPSTKHGYCGSLGHTSENETGLIYMRARYMDPVTGRFISEDPTRDKCNWYAYCGSNPVDATDFTGLVYGVDDELNAQAEMGSAAVKGGRGAIQQLMDSIVRALENRVNALGAEVEDLGLEGSQSWLRVSKGSRGIKMRLDWSGTHGGKFPFPHFNTSGGLPNHVGLEDIGELFDVIERIVAGW